MSRKKIFLIRFDADEVVGMGHFNRCYAFGRQLIEAKSCVYFVAKHINPNIENILLDSKLNFIKVPEAVNWANEVDFINQQINGEIAGFILDIATLYAFKDLEGATAYANGLKRQGKTILIDGMGDNALMPKIKAAADVIVVPYFGADDLILEMKKESMYLTGPKYYIFSQEYRNGRCAQREIRANADRVLVTLGGADPLNITVKILEALAMIGDLNLEIRVVIGPNFKVALEDKIRCRAASSEQHIMIIDRPESLIEHMLWCDVALTSSGLTKYELAITGTPSVQISLNKDHAQINEYFIRYGSMKYLGMNSDIEADFIALELKNLLNNYEERNQMSHSGQKLLDSHGVNRIIEMIGV